MKWFRQLNCDHEYFKTVTNVALNDKGQPRVYTRLYCPKCSKSIRLLEANAEHVLKCQEIKKEFNKKGG